MSASEFERRFKTSAVGTTDQCSKVFFVGHMLHPSDRRAVLALLEGDVGHGLVRRGAVPMLLLGRAPEESAANLREMYRQILTWLQETTGPDQPAPPTSAPTRTVLSSI